MFVDSVIIKQQFYCSYLWIGGGVTQMVIFLDMWPQKVLERSVIYQVNLKQLQAICKFTASPCQILCRDGVYICKSCYNKVKKNKVPCRAVAYKSLGELSPNELLLSQTRIKAISQKHFLQLERLCSRVSHKTNGCIFKNLI